MKRSALTLGLMLAVASCYVAGCGGSGGSGTGIGGHTGSGGKGSGGSTTGTGGHFGTGGTMGTGGRADGGVGTGGATDGGVGTGGATDAGAGTGGTTDGATGTGGATDGATGTGGATDAGGGDAPADGVSRATLADVWKILSNNSTPAADTSPGCVNCHDGVGPDGGAPTTLPHSMNFTTANDVYNSLVGSTSGVDSIICGPSDGSAGWKRVLPSNAEMSAIVSKLRAGLGIGTTCGGKAMPLNPSNGDGGTTTHHMITTDQLNTIIDWINSGAGHN